MDLYREHILDHYRNPRNRGTLKNPTISHTAHNPVCGDSLTIDIQIENGVISDIRFDGAGCAISIASASILMERVLGKSVAEALSNENIPLSDELGIDITGARVKCAGLARGAFQAALKKLE